MSNDGHFQYYLGGDPSQHLERSGFCEDAQITPGNGSIGKIRMVATEGKGEVKCGGEDGRSSGAPHREKRGGESEDFSSIRRGRGVYSSFTDSCDFSLSRSGWTGTCHDPSTSDCQALVW